MKPTIALIAAGLILGACVQERIGVSHNELPQPVVRTLQREAPGKMNSIIRETKDGRVTYHAKVTSGDKGWDVVVAQDGTLISKKDR